MFISCGDKAKEFDSRCQGWGHELALSHAIYDQLNQHNFTRYLAIKSSSDRGSYGFTFLGQTATAGVFVHSDGVKLITGSISLPEVDKVFAISPKNKQTLQGYTGSGDVWSHLFCAYISIHAPEYSKKTVLS